MTPTPTSPGRTVRHADFPTLAAALDHAAQGETGVNFHDLRGGLTLALPYAELRERAMGRAQALLASRLAPGERVGLVAETAPGFVIDFFACVYARLVPATLPLPQPLAGEEAYVDQLARLLAAAGAVRVLAPLALAGWADVAAARAGLSPAPLVEDAKESAGVLPAPAEDDLCYVQFSSGSTREPTGVPVTHRMLMANARAITADGLKVTAADRAVSWLPLFHDMGLVGFLLAAVACQMSVDVLPTEAFVRRPLLWPTMMSRGGGTISYSPSFGYDLCARRAGAANLAELDLSRWRVAGVGGDMVRAEPLDAFAQRFAAAGFSERAFVASYGMAEATLALTMAPLGRRLTMETVAAGRMERTGEAAAPDPGERTRAFARCGPALEEHALEVRDEAGRPLPERRVGRIHVRGPSLMAGYDRGGAGGPDADGWLDTGDLGFLAEGEVVITGRSKDLILLNGRNVWPQDLEWLVEQRTPGLRSGDVAAFAAPEGEGPQAVVLVQARMADAERREALRASVAALLRGQLALEAEVRLVGARALPQTSSGKLMRTRARALFLAGAFPPEPG